MMLISSSSLDYCILYLQTILFKKDIMWNPLNSGGYNGGGFQGGYVNPSLAFNRWGNNGVNYQVMNGYTFVDYSGGWNVNLHDQMLRTNIDIVYQKWDINRSGTLEGNEFFIGYRELCLRMGLCPPVTSQEFMTAAYACDTFRNGRISKMQMFNLFKRMQGINQGFMFDGGMMGGMGMGGMGMGGMGMGMGGMGMGMGGMGMGGMGMGGMGMGMGGMGMGMGNGWDMW